MKVREISKCAVCCKNVGAVNGLLFYVLTIQRMAFDHAAVRTLNGVELIVGSPRIAEALAPDPEIAKPFGEPVQVCICDECACRRMTPIAALEEIASKHRDEVAS